MPSGTMVNCSAVAVSATSSLKKSSSPSISEERSVSDKEILSSVSLHLTIPAFSPAVAVLLSVTSCTAPFSVISLPESLYDICETVFPLPELPEELLLEELPLLLPAETFTLCTVPEISALISGSDFSWISFFRVSVLASLFARSS